MYVWCERCALLTEICVKVTFFLVLSALIFIWDTVVLATIT